MSYDPVLHHFNEASFALFECLEISGCLTESDLDRLFFCGSVRDPLLISAWRRLIFHKSRLDHFLSLRFKKYYNNTGFILCRYYP